MTLFRRPREPFLKCIDANLYVCNHVPMSIGIFITFLGTLLGSGVAAKLVGHLLSRNQPERDVDRFAAWEASLKQVKVLEDQGDSPAMQTLALAIRSKAHGSLVSQIVPASGTDAFMVVFGFFITITGAGITAAGISTPEFLQTGSENASAVLLIYGIPWLLVGILISLFGLASKWERDYMRAALLDIMSPDDFEIVGHGKWYKKIKENQLSDRGEGPMFGRATRMLVPPDIRFTVEYLIRNSLKSESEKSTESGGDSESDPCDSGSGRRPGGTENVSPND